MTNDEINRYIHTEIMGKCLSYDYGSSCSDCGYHIDTREHDAPPNYCSDASPRYLLQKVVEKLQELQCYQFPDLVDVTYVEANNGCTYAWPPSLLKTSAEQIARGCVEAHKNQ